MRVLLDECVPRRLRNELGDLAVSSVQDMGWAGLKNGALIERAASQFDAMFTVDRDFGTGLRTPLPIALVILEAGTTDPTLLRPHMPAVVRALSTVRPGQVVRVGVRPLAASNTNT